MSLETCFSPPVLIQSFVDPLKINSSCLLILSELPTIPHLGFWEYFPYLGLTCLLEAPIYLLGKKKNQSYLSTLCQILFLNAFSHPWVTWFFPWIGLKWNWTAQTNLAAGEGFALGSEFLLLLLFYQYSLNRALLVALIANLTSWWIGIYLT